MRYAILILIFSCLCGLLHSQSAYEYNEYWRKRKQEEDDFRKLQQYTPPEYKSKYNYTPGKTAEEKKEDRRANWDAEFIQSELNNQKAREEKKAKEEKDLEAYWKQTFEEKETKARLDYFVTSFDAKKYVALGFNEVDAYKYATVKNYEKKDATTGLVESAFIEADIPDEFYYYLPNGTFDELIGILNKYKGGSLKKIELLKALGKKFPDKEQTIDTYVINECMLLYPYVYGEDARFDYYSLVPKHLTDTVHFFIAEVAQRNNLLVAQQLKTFDYLPYQVLLYKIANYELINYMLRHNMHFTAARTVIEVWKMPFVKDNNSHGFSFSTMNPDFDPNGTAKFYIQLLLSGYLFTPQSLELITEQDWKAFETKYNKTSKELKKEWIFIIERDVNTTDKAKKKAKKALK